MSRQRVLPEPTIALPPHLAGFHWRSWLRVRVTSGWLNYSPASAVYKRMVEHGNAEGAERWRTHVGHRVRYSSRHDAYACLACDVWIEERCRLGDACDSGYCTGRPDKPSEVVT